MLKLFIAPLKRLYENNCKSFNQEKNMCQLHAQGHLRRPAWFLHATPLWTNCFSDYNAVLFSTDYGFIKHTPFVSPTNNLHA